MNKKITKLLLITPCLILLPSCGENQGNNFCDIFKWGSSVKADSLDSIEVEKGWIGTSPENTLISQKSTQNPQDFSNFVSWINNVKLTETDNNLVGGSYVEISFNLLDKNSYQIRVNNGSICVTDSGSVQYYLPSIQLPEVL